MYHDAIAHHPGPRPWALRSHYTVWGKDLPPLLHPIPICSCWSQDLCLADITMCTIAHTLVVQDPTGLSACFLLLLGVYFRFLLQSEVLHIVDMGEEFQRKGLLRGLNTTAFYHNRGYHRPDL